MADFEKRDCLDNDLLESVSLASWNYLLSRIRLKLYYFLAISPYFFLKKLSIDLLLSGTLTSSGATELAPIDDFSTSLITKSSL
jgi:hypothetical protein